MCDKTETALAVLKQKMPEEISIVFEQVVADNKKQGERMTRLEKGFTDLSTKVASIDTKVAAMDTKLDKITQYIERGSWLSRFWDKYGDKIVIVGMIVLACSVLGLSASEVIQLWKGI